MLELSRSTTVVELGSRLAMRHENTTKRRRETVVPRRSAAVDRVARLSGGDVVMGQKMPQGRVESGGMGAVVAAERFADVVDDHLMHPLGPTRLMHQVVAESRRRDLGNVLVFGDRIDLVFVEVAQAQDVVLRDHGRSSL